MVVTDLSKNTQTDFVLSSRAFMDMANKGMGQSILKLPLVDVEYKRLADIHKLKINVDRYVYIMHECMTCLRILDFVRL